MIQIIDKSQCCGCTACKSVCPQDAIEMKPDVLGFLYPEVEISKCINCGLCEKVCVFSTKYDKSLNFSVPDAYAARHIKMSEIETSRSGAAFIAISDRILEKGGVVYGAGYSDHFKIVHKRAVTKEERDEFKGSKYVQSDLNTVFRQVRRDLFDGFFVLFSGTPCQTAGLSSYIGEKLRKNLFLVDIVCHGVPGPYIWRDYIAYLEKKLGAEIVEVDFRDKQKFGWTAHKESFKFRNRQDKITFTYLFYKRIMFRRSCGVCPYANTRRPSDITIADYWGWEKTDSSFNADDKGVSLVLVNTEKGRKVFGEAQKDLNVIPARLEDCMQPNLMHPTTIHPKRDEFEDYYAKKGFVHTMQKYGYLGWRYNVVQPIYRAERILKRLFHLLNSSCQCF